MHLEVVSKQSPFELSKTMAVLTVAEVKKNSAPRLDIASRCRCSSSPGATDEKALRIVERCKVHFGTFHLRSSLFNLVREGGCHRGVIHRISVITSHLCKALFVEKLQSDPMNYKSQASPEVVRHFFVSRLQIRYFTPGEGYHWYHESHHANHIKGSKKTSKQLDLRILPALYPAAQSSCKSSPLLFAGCQPCTLLASRTRFHVPFLRLSGSKVEQSSKYDSKVVAPKKDEQHVFRISKDS